MSLPSDPLSGIDQAAIRLRVTLTVIKARVQLTARRNWAMNGTEQSELNARLAAIDECVNHAVEDLTRLQQLVDSLHEGRPKPPS